MRAWHERREKREIPRTTPPFQNTKPANEARRAMYGHRRVRIRTGLEMIATPILRAQSMKSRTRRE